ncbi:hypothetical protein [Alkalitalea saponilacus]|uniref:hypothetical protein n=1 Tax=Alkalitalea saponilacus TaxID=889453 RepID=UPI0011773E58|nr:hypothetical protein [Alkalitalea saponilacus]
MEQRKAFYQKHFARCECTNHAIIRNFGNILCNHSPCSRPDIYAKFEDGFCDEMIWEALLRMGFQKLVYRRARRIARDSDHHPECRENRELICRASPDKQFLSNIFIAPHFILPGFPFK